MDNTSLRVQINCIDELVEYIARTLPSDIETAKSNIYEKNGYLLEVGLDVEIANESYGHINKIYTMTQDLIQKMNGPNKAWLVDLRQRLNSIL